MNKLYKLFKIQCYDLLCLMEMERNGILFNTEKAMEHAKDIERKQLTMLRDFYKLINCEFVSITSNDHLSAILYGGSIVIDSRIPVGHYMSGTKQGQVRYRIQKEVFEFPRIVNPIAGTETKKSYQRIDKGEEKEHTLWEVNEPVLKSLKATGTAKKLLTIILEYSKLEKLRGTYLQGYTDLIEKMNWPHNMLHGNFNQCTVVTGRLSSSKPNLQNCDPQTKKYMETRYK